MEMLYGIITVVFGAFISTCSCAEITSLPGWSGDFPFKQHSGYLQASPTHFLHYWFVESSSGNAATDPLIVWLNGGPGCSSLDGLLSELGPIHIRDDGRTLYLNPNSWSQNASIIFLEAPAGVGFSYSTDGNVTTNDDQTSMENYIALKQFYSLFPQFRDNDLYITGESYGGIYVPTFVQRILDGQPEFKINLKGMAVGNGMLDVPLNTDTLMEFSFYHGLISQKVWDTLGIACCKGCTDTCQFHSLKTSFCQKTVNETMMDAWGAVGLNVYDLYRDCYHPDVMTSSRFKADLRGLAHAAAKNHLMNMFEKRATDQSTVNPATDVGLSPPCINGTAITNYLNQASVRQALGIPETVATWAICSDEVGEKYHSIYQNQYEHVTNAINAGIRVMIYNGDTDMACNVLMGQKFSQNLKRPLLKGKKPWHFNKQVAGFVTVYNGVQFVTIKGAGHMVPQWRAGQSLKMITQFLNNQPLL